MKKTFVLDTNVILHTAHSLLSFQDNTIIIPDVVLEEPDKFKKERNEIGANAREASRIIESLRNKGSLLQGVDLPNGGILKIENNYIHIKLPEGWDVAKKDNCILRICKGLTDSGKNPILVSRDTIMRIKADIMGIKAEDFTTEQAPSPDDQYTGRREVFTTIKKLNEFYKAGSDGKLKPKDIYEYDEVGTKHFIDRELILNEFFVIRNEENAKQSALGYFNGKNIVPLVFSEAKPYGITPRNAGQRFLLEAFLRGSESAPLVVVKGAAGTSKTFMAMACALDMVWNTKTPMYRKIIICRPTVTMGGEELGFLPGDINSKVEPYMRPIWDSLEQLVDQNEDERYKNESVLRDKVEEIVSRVITTEAIGFLRGRSLVKTLVIIDEAQNTTPSVIRSIITRIGQGSKVILLGDPSQIDNPYLDSRTNGLSYAAEKMKGSALCWQITMKDDECERSELAFEAAKLM
jgi:PhoH-like ATPase